MKIVPMKIAIDCRYIGMSGIGRYLEGVLYQMLQTENEFILLGDEKKISRYIESVQIPAWRGIIVSCRIKPFSVPETLFFPKKILKTINSADVYFSPYFNIPAGIKIPVYTTIHDIIFADLKKLTSKAGLAIRMFFYKRAAKKSQAVFTVSRFSASRIKKHLGEDLNVVVTYSAVCKCIEEYNLKPEKTKTIVFAGNIKKHKGLSLLLDAFINVKKLLPEYKLVIVGEKNNFRSYDGDIFSKTDAAGDSVIFTGFIGEKELCNVIASASILVQPSLYEGFCLPPLEALFLGSRVLISDIPVLREIYEGYPAVFFKAGNVQDLQDKILKLLEKQSEHIVLSKEQREKYTFKKTAHTILEVFNTRSF